jgi:hypothetical protein
MPNASLFVIAWTRRTFRITLSTSASMEVDGIIANGAPLGIHIRDRYIDITHLPSGQRIASVTSLGAAMGIVYGIAPLTDWTQEAPVITKEIADTIAILTGTAFVPRIVP